MEKFLIRNAVKCLECDVTISSVHVHDYKTCGCYNQTMVDGGLDYCRYGGVDMEKIQLETIYSDVPHEIIREYLHRGGRGIGGNEPLKYVLLKDMSNNWVSSVIDYEKRLRPNNKYLPIFENEVEYRLKHDIIIDDEK